MVGFMGMGCFLTVEMLRAWHPADRDAGHIPRFSRVWPPPFMKPAGFFANPAIFFSAMPIIQERELKPQMDADKEG